MDVNSRLQQSYWQKVVKTVFLVIVWACIGLCLEITGPTLIDLKIRTKSNYESVATAVSGRSLGYFIGSALGGLLVDKIGRYSNIIVAICLDGMAAFTVGLPWSPMTELIFFISVCSGTFEGVINIAGQKLIMDMWLEKAASPLHILHGGFGIGSFIIPLIANPFLAVSADDKTNTTVDLLMSTSIPTSTEVVYIKPSRIEYAYTIAAVIVIVVSGVFYVYHVADWRAGRLRTDLSKSKKADLEDDLAGGTNGQVMTFRQMFNPATCAGGRLAYGIVVLSLVFLYFTQAVGAERVAGKFIRAFAIDYHGFSKDDGSYINTVYWIAFSAGRVAGFITARCISIRILIMIEAGGFLLASIALTLFGTSGPTALWVIMPILGAFVAPLFPSGIGWANFHLEVTGVGLTIFLLGGSLGGIAYMKLIGFLYDHYGPKMFIYTLLCQGIATFVMAILMNIAGRRHGNRFTWADSNSDVARQPRTSNEKTDTML